MQPPMNPQENAPHQPRRQKTEVEKLTILIRYLIITEGSTRKLSDGSVKALADRYSISTQQIRNYYRDFTGQLDQGILYPSLAPMRDIPRGPESGLDENLAECLREFNSVDGYMLPIRDFTKKFNENYVTTYSVCVHCTDIQSYSMWDSANLM